MSGHTPGPWRPGCSDNLNWGVNGPDGGICDVWSGLVPDNGKANAYLIAAAPQLLMALEDALAILQPLADQLPSVKSRCEGYSRIVRLARPPEEV